MQGFVGGSGTGRGRGTGGDDSEPDRTSAMKPARTGAAPPLTSPAALTRARASDASALGLKYLAPASGDGHDQLSHLGVLGFEVDLKLMLAQRLAAQRAN